MKLKSFFVLALISGASAAAQGPAAATEFKIIALEKAWNQAYKFRDRKALGEILNDSIILVNDDGRVDTRNTFLAGIDTAAPSDEQQADPESIAVHVFGNVAIATGVYRTKESVKGKSVVKRNRFVDTWISKGDSWVCVAGSATPILP